MSLNNAIIVIWFLIGAGFAIDSWTISDRRREFRSFWLSVFFLFVAVFFAAVLK